MSDKEHPPMNHEYEARQVDTFVVFDLDRTLLRTDTLTDMVCLQLLDHGVGLEQVRADLNFIHQQIGTSFSLLEYLEAQYGSELYLAVRDDVEALVESGELVHDLVYEGTADLLSELERNEVPFAILTYGNRESQEFKLRLFRRLMNRTPETMHATITLESKKSDWIARTWQGTGDGSLLVPTEIYPESSLSTRMVVVVDDKRANLESSDERIKGILIDNAPEGAKEGATIVELADFVRRGGSLSEYADAA
jgi:hypothetical protein